MKGWATTPSFNKVNGRTIMGQIPLINETSRKPQRKIDVDEFSYTVSTGSGEAVITLPGSRSYNTTLDHMVVLANGLKIFSGVEYSKSSSTTITAETCDMFPDGNFQKNCKIDFELYKIN